MFIGNKKCRIYAACGVSQTPNWNYESEEAVLKELSYANFRCVKVSDTLLFARKK